MDGARGRFARNSLRGIRMARPGSRGRDTGRMLCRRGSSRVGGPIFFDVGICNEGAVMRLGNEGAVVLVGNKSAVILVGNKSAVILL